MIQPPEHFKEQYAQFREWFQSKYTSLNCMCITFSERHNPYPSLINMEQVMWDTWLTGYMKKTAEIKALKDVPSGTTPEKPQ